MTGLAATLLSILTIAAIALTAGGIYMLARGGDRKKGVLMLVCAAVMVGNVLIMTV